MIRHYQAGMSIAQPSSIMSSLLSAIQTAWPYLLGLWLIPFLIIAVKMMRRPTVARLEEFPYTRNRALLSPAECSLLSALEQAAGKDYRIFGKVRVADVVGIQPIDDRNARQRALDRISAKHFEFILCDKDDLSIRCAIELDDKSHGSHKRQERDTFLQGICRAISLPLVQIPAARSYSVIELRKKILAALSAGSETEVVGSEEPFSVGLAADARLDDRPWTLDEYGIFGEKPEDISAPGNFTASLK
jgi:hypothetical protein